MTLSTTISRTSYPGAGSTGPFAYPFRIFAAADLLVTKRTVAGAEVTLAYPADYTVTGVANASGSITLTTALAAGETLVIRRKLTVKQLTSIRNQGPFFAGTHEDVFDRLVMIDQQQQDELDRTLKLSESYDPGLYRLTMPAPAPGKVLGWDANGLTSMDPAVSTVTFGGVVPLAGNGSPEGNVAAAISQPFGQLDAVLPGLKWLKRKGADVYGWAPDVPPLLVPALTGGTGSINAFGDSFTTGNGASPASESYVNVLTAALGGAVTNAGVGGTGVYTAIAAFFTGGGGGAAAAAPRNPIATLITWMAGFNDLRRGGAAAKTLSKIKECLRAFIALSFSNTTIAASDGAVTKVGAWTNFTPAGGQTRGAAIGGNALSGVSGMSISWPFTGDSLIIGTFVSDGVTYLHGPATIKIDGVLVQTFNPDQKTDNIADSAYDNGRVPSAIILRGLGSGAHTVLIEPTHATRPFIVDYLSTLVAPGDAMPLLIGTPARMNALGYAQAPALATDAVMAAGAAAIMDVVNELPDYPIRSVWPNSQYDLATGVSADNIHPNNLGHYQIAKAFLLAIQTAVTPFMRGTAAQTTRVGRAAVASAASTTAVGDNAQATSPNATAVGKDALASSSSTALGTAASATGATSLAVGISAAAPAVDSTAVGAGATVTGAGSASSTVVGSGASSSNTNVTAVGKGANSNSDRGTAVGAVAAATAGGGTAVGSNTVAGHTDATALGRGAATTAANQVMLGRNTETVVAPGNASVGGAGKNVGLYGVAAVARAAAIAAPTAPSAGYVQAEAQSMKTAVDAIRVALTNIGLTL